MSFKNKDKLVSTKPISVLFLIINKTKVDYYLDFLQDYRINLQYNFLASGTTNENFFSDETARKTVIMSFILDENIKACLKELEEKFATIKDGKGVAFTVPMSSVMGVSYYNFLANNIKTLI